MIAVLLVRGLDRRHLVGAVQIASPYLEANSEFVLPRP